MEKKSRNMILLLVLLALLIGLYAVTATHKKGSSQTSEDKGSSSGTVAAENSKIAAFTSDEVEKISYTTVSGTSIILKDGSSWKLKGEEGLPLDQDIISTMVNGVISTTTDNQVSNNAKDLSTYGLKNPQLSVTFTCATAGSITVKVGDKTPTGDGAYYSLGDDNAVYIGGSELLSDFAYSKAGLIQKDETPTINPQYITNLKLEKSSGKIEIADEADNKWNASGNMPWVLKQGYDTEVPADYENAEKQFENYGNFALGDCVAYKGTREEEKKYGLDKPTAKISLTYYDSDEAYNSTDSAIKAKGLKHFTISFGKTDPSGGNYYCQINGSKLIYLMEKETVDKMIGIKRIDFVSSLVEPVNLIELGDVDIKTGSDTFKMHIDSVVSGSASSAQASPAQIAKDPDNIIRTFYWNGKKVDKDDFTSIYSSLVGITVDGEASGNEKNLGDDKKVLEAEFKKNDGTITKVAYYKYNDNFYLAKVDGKCYFRANKKTVDSAIKTIQKGISAN